MSDWTTSEDGRANSSYTFVEAENHVERLLRDSAWTLINCGPKSVAGLIVSQLAHAHRFGPLDEPSKAITLLRELVGAIAIEQGHGWEHIRDLYDRARELLSMIDAGRDR